MTARLLRCITNLPQFLHEDRCQSGFAVRLWGEAAGAGVRMSTGAAWAATLAVGSQPHRADGSAEGVDAWPLSRAAATD